MNKMLILWAVFSVLNVMISTYDQNIYAVIGWVNCCLALGILIIGEIE